MRAALTTVALGVVMSVVTTACGGTGGDSGEEAGPVRLLTHEGFPLPEPLMADLERELGAPVAVVVEKDPASMVDLLTASSAPPGVDVVLGLDSLAVGTVLDAGLFAPYSPPAADHLEPTLRLGDDVIIPMSWTDVCFNFDKFWFEPPEPSFVGPRGPGEAGPDTESPAAAESTPSGSAVDGDGDGDGVEDSTADESAGEAQGETAGEGEGQTEDQSGPDTTVPRDAAAVVPRPDPPSDVASLSLEPYNRLVTMADPATDRFSLAFIAGLAGGTGSPPADTAPATSSVPATASAGSVSTRGDDGNAAAAAGPTPAVDPALVEVLRGLRANGLAVTDSFQNAYFGEFTAGSTTGTRPLVLASALMPAVSVRLVEPLPAGVQTAVINDQCARLVDYAGLLADAPNPRLARRLMDLLVGPEFQFELSDGRGSQPARTDLIRRPEVAAFGIAVQPVLLDPLTTARQVPALMAAWTEAGRTTAEGATGQGAAGGQTSPGAAASDPTDVTADG